MTLETISLYAHTRDIFSLNDLETLTANFNNAWTDLFFQLI